MTPIYLQMDEYDTSIAKAPAVRETAGEFLLIIKKQFQICKRMNLS